MKTILEMQTWALGALAIVFAVVLPALIEFVATTAPVASTIV